MVLDKYHTSVFEKFEILLVMFIKFVTPEMPLFL